MDIPLGKWDFDQNPQDLKFCLRILHEKVLSKGCFSASEKFYAAYSLLSDRDKKHFSRLHPDKPPCRDVTTFMKSKYGRSSDPLESSQRVLSSLKTVLKSSILSIDTLIDSKKRSYEKASFEQAKSIKEKKV